MRRMVVSLGLLGLVAGAASADPTDLANGVLIAHHPPGLQYSQGQDYCQRYAEEFAITSCKQQHNRIDLDGNQGQSSVWYVLAAWSEAKEWCGTEFGFGSYDPYIYGFSEWGPCSPEGDLEIPTDTWPGPNAGTALVTTGAPWSGNFLAVYYFAGYAYYEGIIPLGVDPATGFGGTGNCATPPEDWSATAYGGMGLFRDGIYACPGAGGFGPEGEGVAACCMEETCLLVTAEECEEMGGEFHAEWATCTPNPCPGGIEPGGGDGPHSETIWFVCPEGQADFATIREAVEDPLVLSGDVVELCDYTFTGELNRDIDFAGKSLTLRSRNGNPEDCVISCQDVPLAHGFLFDQDDVAGVLIQGIKVRDCPGGDTTG